MSSLTYIYYSYMFYNAWKYTYLLEYTYNTLYYTKKAYRYVTKPKIDHETVSKDSEWILCDKEEEEKEEKEADDENDNLP